MDLGTTISDLTVSFKTRSKRFVNEAASILKTGLTVVDKIVTYQKFKEIEANLKQHDEELR